MRLRSTTAVLLLAIGAAACGSSEPVAAPASTDPAPPEATEPTVTSAPPIVDEPQDDEAVSAAQIEGRWFPVAVDGVALDTSEGDYWTFNGTDTALEIGGFDGCNNFGTTGDPDPASASIVDGRLENVEMAAEEAGCEEGVESGPYPKDGAQLTVNDDATVLTVQGSSGTIELSRTAPATTDDEEPATTGDNDGAASDEPLEPDVEAGSVDGPLMRHPEPSGTRDGMAAEVTGELQLADDCLYLSSPDIDERYPVLWPARTAWDAEREVVVLPSGSEIAVGESADGGGGYLYVSAVETIAGSEAGEHAARCVDNEYGEIAVVNNFDTAISPG